MDFGARNEGPNGGYVGVGGLIFEIHVLMVFGKKNCTSYEYKIVVLVLVKDGKMRFLYKG